MDTDRCLRDIVALTALPAVWCGAEPPRIAESLAAAIFATLGPELVYVSLTEGPRRLAAAVAQIDRCETSPAVAARLGPVIVDWVRSRNADELLYVPSPLQPGALCVLARPIGLDGELGAIAVACDMACDGETIGPFHHLVLNVAVTQVTVAIQNVLLMRSLRAARAEAERANGMKDEFLAMVSHELRTPLSAILCWTRLLRRPDAAPEHRDRCLDVIERNTRLQAQLISDLLDVSRIIAGKLNLELSSVDLSLVVEASIDACRAAAEAKQVKLEPAIDPAPLTVRGDGDRMQQVITNLITNAIKFTPNGGSVTVSLARRDDRAVIVVRDTGEGLAPEFLPHVFERFSQADPSRAAPHGGLGLGLSIVQHLVKLHGGEVRAESEGLGLGATFTIALPCEMVPTQTLRRVRHLHRIA